VRSAGSIQQGIHVTELLLVLLVID